MYREGLLPSGEVLQAVVKDDIVVPGTSFTCVSCHLRSGLGSFEGGVTTTPANGKSLYQSLTKQYKQVKVDIKYFPSIEQRPAYNDATLAEALRSGVTPSGQVMNPIMPRYLIDDADMTPLIAYLKSLSSEPSPGVTGATLAFATVITDDVSPAQYEAMLAPLEQYIQQKNNMVKLFKREKRSERMAATMLPSSDIMYKTITLSRWLLKGPPDTWRKQLEEYYRKEPVFALLGGISNGDWQPIHDFSETHHVPCLFPHTDFPVISTTDWYTLYFSKGFFQEGEAAARYLNGSDEMRHGSKVIQLVRASRKGQALADGFRTTWRELGQSDAVTIMLNDNATVSGDFLQKILLKEKPAALLLWDGATALPALQHLSADGINPGPVVVSAGYLGSDLWSIPEAARSFTRITYPYRLSQTKTNNGDNSEALKKGAPTGIARDVIVKQSNITAQMLTLSLMDLRGNYYRDNLLDVIGMMKDQDSQLYERLSFGPGQRYASKGCYIVQLSNGVNPELVKKSGWVIY
jgi:hypothetical protein